MGGGCSLVRKVRAAAPLMRAVAWERDMDGVAGAAAAPMQAGRQHGVVVNAGATLKYGRHPQRSGLSLLAFLIMNPRPRLRQCCID